MRRKAFTLVELIVVIIILAILGTIAFISLSGYSKEARDAKRITDTSSLLSKINIEETRGTPISELITNTRDVHLKILGETGSLVKTFGEANFRTLKEDEKNFRDPSNKSQNYPMAYAFGGSGRDAYKFIEIATVSEKNNSAVIKGNYYKLDDDDAKSLFLTGGTTVNDGGINIEDGGNNLPYIPNEKNKGGGNSSGGSGGENVVFEGNKIEKCIARGDVISADGERFTNTIENGGKICDTEDLILCSGEGYGYQIAACNAGANIAGYYGDCFGGEEFFLEKENCSSEKVGYHYQWMGDIEGGKTATGISLTDRGITSSDSLLSRGWEKLIGTENDTWVINTPCGDGYHIPTREEWENFYKISGLAGRNFEEKFLIPALGVRNYSDGKIDLFFSHAYYWSSSPSFYKYDCASSLFFSRNWYTTIKMEEHRMRSNGHAIRCFKD